MMFRQIECSASRVQTHSVGPGLDHLADEAHGRSNPGQECVAAWRKVAAAVDATKYGSLAMIDSFIDCVRFEKLALAIGTCN